VEAPSSVRKVISLNAGWRFLAGDEPRASDPSFDDRGWASVDLPHTWNARDGEDGGNNYRRGAGWYRRMLVVDSALRGRRLYLQFDGASLMAEVWVNGQLLGKHEGGFARFRFDATDALKAGPGNTIAVRVDNGKLGIPPISADFTFFGGLYRGVSLLATDPVQICATDWASPGVFITTPRIGTDSADVNVRAELENHSSSPCDGTERITVRDAGGAVVGSLLAKVPLAAHGSVELARTITLPHPRLWNGRADPYLYSVSVELLVAGLVRDSVVQPLGLRTYRVDPDRGFILNGRPLDLHGVTRHQDRIDKGWAISLADEAQDFGFVLELGCTAIRVAHYPQADTWYSRCDRSGVVAWAEIPFVNEALPDPRFLENARQQMRELIRQNFNHPAICFWGVGNETRGPDADPVIVSLAALVHEEDSSRLSTYASNHKESDPRNWHTDVVAFNRYFGWYSGQLSDFATDMDNTHARHPGTPIAVSEYGAGASLFQHEDPPARPAPRGPFHPEEYQALFHEASWSVLQKRPYIWGKFIWTLFDFAADDRAEGDSPGRNDKGLVSYDRRTRKDAFYFYKANWSGEPVLHIDGSRFAVRTKEALNIKVYSNASEVELILNGTRLGRKSSTDHIFRWSDAHLVRGENRVEAEARIDGKRITDGCTWTYHP